MIDMSRKTVNTKPIACRHKDISGTLTSHNSTRACYSKYVLLSYNYILYNTLSHRWFLDVVGGSSKVMRIKPDAIISKRCANVQRNTSTNDGNGSRKPPRRNNERHCS